MKITLFGASGFVGSNLADHLDRTGKHELLLCDIEDRKLRLKFENRSFRYRKVDITSAHDCLNDIVAGSDVVIDLAAYVRPAEFVTNPLDVVRLNLFGCLDVVSSCVRHQKRLIHFSTSEVYGKTGGSHEPFREDTSDLILGPVKNQRWIYSCAKQLLDRIIYAHGVDNGLNYTLVRPFNFVGPLMDKYIHIWRRSDNPRVFANFMSALVYQPPLLVVDGGHSRRCFTYIGDAVTAIEAILDHPEEMNRQIVNVGNPANETSIIDLARLMVDLYATHASAGAQPVITPVPAEEFYGEGYEDCDRRLPDISKLQSIGWRPRYGLEETIRLSMDYFIENRARLVAALGE